MKEASQNEEKINLQPRIESSLTNERTELVTLVPESAPIKFAKAGTPVEGVVDQIRGNTQTFIDRNLRNSPIRVEWYKRLRTFERLAAYPIIALSLPVLASIGVKVVEAIAPSLLSSVLGQGLAWLVPALLTIPMWVPLALVVLSTLALISSTISRSNAFSHAERATAFPRMKHYYRKPGQTSTLEEEKKK